MTMITPSYLGETIEYSSLHACRSTLEDPTSTSIVELPHPAPLFGSTGGACSVRTLNVSAVAVDCTRPSKIEYSELYMPGWHAETNGQPTRVSRDGPVFQSVIVPAGRSTVEYVFTPPHATLALAAFILGLILLALGSPRLRRIRVPIGRRRLGQHEPLP